MLANLKKLIKQLKILRYLDGEIKQLKEEMIALNCEEPVDIPDITQLSMVSGDEKPKEFEPSDCEQQKREEQFLKLKAEVKELRSTNEALNNKTLDINKQNEELKISLINLKKELEVAKSSFNQRYGSEELSNLTNEYRKTEKENVILKECVEKLKKEFLSLHDVNSCIKRDREDVLKTKEKLCVDKMTIFQEYLKLVDALRIKHQACESLKQEKNYLIEKINKEKELRNDINDKMAKLKSYLKKRNWKYTNYQRKSKEISGDGLSSSKDDIQNEYSSREVRNRKDGSRIKETAKKMRDGNVFRVDKIDYIDDDDNAHNHKKSVKKEDGPSNCQEHKWKCQEIRKPSEKRVTIVDKHPKSRYNYHDKHNYDVHERGNHESRLSETKVGWLQKLFKK